jgi:hypothetical protein
MGVLGHSDVSKITVHKVPAELSIAPYVYWWLNHRVSRPTARSEAGQAFSKGASLCSRLLRLDVRRCYAGRKVINSLIGQYNKRGFPSTILPAPFLHFARTFISGS